MVERRGTQHPLSDFLPRGTKPCPEVRTGAQAFAPGGWVAVSYNCLATRHSGLDTTILITGSPIKNRLKSHKISRIAISNRRSGRGNASGARTQIHRTPQPIGILLRSHCLDWSDRRAPLTNNELRATNHGFFIYSKLRLEKSGSRLPDRHNRLCLPPPARELRPPALRLQLIETKGSRTHLNRAHQGRLKAERSMPKFTRQRQTTRLGSGVGNEDYRIPQHECGEANEANRVRPNK